MALLMDGGSMFSVPFQRLINNESSFIILTYMMCSGPVGVGFLRHQVGQIQRHSTQRAVQRDGLFTS
jgi:hypothetical protein